MAKELLNTSLGDRGAFINKGDLVEFEVPRGRRTLAALAVEINLNTGEAIIHGVDLDTKRKWFVPARNVRRVENLKLNLA